MEKHTEVGVTELREKIRQYLQEAGQGRPVIITSSGYRVAALVSLTDLDRLDQWKRQEDQS